MDNMEQKVNSFIGKKLLDMLMFSMYPDAKIIYREYVQNAFDSIRKAVKEGVLKKVKDGIVSIKIDSQTRTVVIKDNGIGIPVDYSLKILTSVADSQKDGFEQAGVYGIGRLVGAGYCERLEFRTSSVGEPLASIISFDVNETRKILDNKNDHRSATEVMNSIVSWETVEEEIDSHYFKVTLHNVKKDYPILLSEEDIIEYLKEVAPIDYELPFKNNIMFTSIDVDSEFDELQRGLGIIKLSVNNHLDIRKRYGNKVIGTNDEIVGLQYFSLEDEYFGQLAWGWFAITKFSKAIPAIDSNRCIRLRKLNIQIGEANYLNEFFDEARGNNYFYGEIHAVHENLRPNTSRAGLTPTVEANIFFKKLKEYFKELKVLYNLANKAKIAARDIAAASAKINKDGLTETERKEAHADLTSGKKKFESATKSIVNKTTSQGKAAVKILEQYKTDIDNSVLDKKNKPISDVLNLNLDDNNTKDYPQGKKTLEVQEPTLSTPKDLLAPLTTKFPKEQLWIIRKIFKSLTDNCPKGQLMLIEDLKKLVIKDLER